MIDKLEEKSKIAIQIKVLRKSKISRNEDKKQIIFFFSTQIVSIQDKNIDRNFQIFLN